MSKGSSMKKPSERDGLRYVELRIQGKQGGALTEDERDFCYKIAMKYKEWVQSKSKEIFVRSAPFGADVGEY